MKTPFILPVRIYYEDTDAGGVVYHSNYLNFFERARTEMLRDLGFEQNELREQSGVIFAVRTMQIEYLRPAKFNDLVHVSAAISQLKKALELIVTEGDGDAESVIDPATLEDHVEAHADRAPAHNAS